MTAAQKKLLDQIDEQYSCYQSLIEKSGGKARDGVNDAWWVKDFKNGIITVMANTKTLACLERLGYIEVLEHDEGKYANFDKIKRIF